MLLSFEKFAPLVLTLSSSCRRWASHVALLLFGRAISSGSLIFQNQFALSLEFVSNHTNEPWVLTNIYAPCVEPSKTTFLDWFKHIQMPDDINWLILGDFNLYQSLEDRNRPGGDYNNMFHFNDAITSLRLVEIPLEGCLISP